MLDADGIIKRELAGKNPNKHHRRSIRLKGYDSTRAGGQRIRESAWRRRRNRSGIAV